MTRKSSTKTDARLLVRTYDTTAHGVSYQRVVQLVREHGLDGAIRELETRGMKPVSEGR